jgi:protein-disulfide isomerase
VLLRRLSGAPADPEDLFFRVDGRPAKGRAAAPITIIEFSDYQCPFCARYTRETLPQVLRDYVETGEVRYVFMNFPLEALHKDALGAAQAATCAGDQGRYWEMHDRLFTNQDALAAPQLAAHAAALGLDGPAFARCLDTHRHLEAIRREMAEGERAGVRGTPSFFVGVTAGGDGVTVKAVKMITGAQPYATFKEAIEGLRAAQKK